eukprot:3921599-Ditylum_brightwellii.AAC.1
MPSQSKREWGAGKKEPAIRGLCGEMWRCSWSEFPLLNERSPQTGEQPLGKKGSPAISRM